MGKEDKINILIVDDMSDNIYSLKNLLHDDNYCFFTSTSGEGALNIAIKKEVHLILLDVQMPGMDGYEVARLLKMNKKTEKIPVIFITAINEGVEHALKGFNAGAVDFLFKPVVPELLKAKVALFINLYRKEQELIEKNQLLIEKNTDLNNAQHKLREINDQLEQLVEKRTIKLSENNRELKRINKVLDNFLNVSAHDLRGPLSNLSTALKLFRKIEDKESREKLLKGIDDSLERIDSTIKGIIEMVELQSYRQNAVQSVSFTKLMNKIMPDYHPQVEKHNATIKADFNDVPEINFVEVYLESIFRNLISNALKYRSEQRDPVIEISASKQNDEVYLLFRDNGMGIDLEKHGNALFKPFSRLKAGKTEGKGIGLHLVKNIVEMNGGNIEVESKPQSGTTFRIKLMAYHLKNSPSKLQPVS